MNTHDAVKFFGSKAQIARILGISKQAVSNWRDKVPLRAALLLEQASYGKLIAERPVFRYQGQV
jgi:DNA-binding transcriptional regulator YdaS (Cro superfamily)